MGHFGMKFWWDQLRSAKEARRTAASEVFIVCLFSLAPLLLLPFIEHLTRRVDSVFAPGTLLASAVSGGQLYLYSFSLFGTLFWLCQKEFPQIERFTPRKWIMMAIVLPMFIIFGVYTIDPSLKRELSPTLVISSVIIYFIYVIIYYILTVFDNLKAPDVQDSLRNSVKDLTSRYNNIEN
jgi:glucan phosphoethanolaminetransferase (alkaline phosphatase superfamily)